MNSNISQLSAIIAFLFAGHSFSQAQSPCPVSITASTDSICAGNFAQLTASSADSYTWSPGAAVSNPSNASVFVGQAGVYTVAASSGSCVSTATIEIFVFSYPNVNVTPSSPSVCIGYNATLTAFGAANYTWTGVAASTGATIGPVYQQSITVYAGSYTVTGSNGPCLSTPAPYHLGNQPPLNISCTASSQTVCLGDPVILTAAGAASYTWTNGSFTTTSNPMTVIPLSSTDYTVDGSTPTCSGTAVVSVTVTDCATGIPVLSVSDLVLKVSPNPVHDLLSITITGSPDNLSLEIYDLPGNLVNKTEPANRHALIDLEGLDNGIYLIRMVGCDKQTLGYKKIVKN